MSDEKRRVWLVFHHPHTEAFVESAWSTQAAAEARREALRIEKGCVGVHRPWCTEVIEMEVAETNDDLLAMLAKAKASPTVSRSHQRRADGNE